MSHGKPLALVLEDDAGAGEALAILLRDWGAEVVLGADGAAVVAALGQRVTQARWLITDYHLGETTNGVAVARQIKADAPATRVLVLTGSTHGQAERDAAEAGFEIMSKPVPADTILAWLERA